MLEITTTEEMKTIPDHVLVRSRWVLCNKGDSDQPDVRARLVSCELNNGERNDMFAASTPPLEGKRMLFTRFVSEQKRSGQPLRISFVDIRKAYFNALPERAMFMRLPKEMGLPPNTVARQVRCVYGTRDAGKLWEDCYTQVLESMGFVTGVSNPCTFYHPIRNIQIVVHGDDFTTLGVDSDLDWYESELKKSFEIKVRGRLGVGLPEPQEIRILNRIVRLDEDGLTYEADPRHSDLLLSSLDMAECTGAATPGVKPLDRDEHAIKSDEPQEATLGVDHDAAIAAICHGDCTTTTDDQWHIDPGPLDDGSRSVREADRPNLARTSDAKAAPAVEISIEPKERKATGSTLRPRSAILGHNDPYNSVNDLSYHDCSNENVRDLKTQGTSDSQIKSLEINCHDSEKVSHDTDFGATETCMVVDKQMLEQICMALRSFSTIPCEENSVSLLSRYAMTMGQMGLGNYIP